MMMYDPNRQSYSDSNTDNRGGYAQNNNPISGNPASNGSVSGQTPAAGNVPGWSAGPSYPGRPPVSPNYGATAPYRTVQPQNAGGQAPAYSWQSQPRQQGYSYQPRQPEQKKKKGGRFALKFLAVVLACAVVSMGSVGAFAWMIQNGVVNVVSQGEENTTAAFTLYRQADSPLSSTPTVTADSLTAQEIAAKVTPSVVLIQNYQVVRQSSDSFWFGWYGYEDDSSAGELSPVGEGSGIIISKDGYIVTNQHVIDGATSLKVITSDGAAYEAELIGEDTQTDLAVIKITTDDELTPAQFGDSSGLQVADEVMAIGNPGGSQLSGSVTFGRVSALNRPVTNSSTGYTVNCIQTDAAINPGNSGGALVDMNGFVVGINSSKIAATEYEGLGFAIPSNTAQTIVSDLIEYGYVKDRAALGFSGEYIDSYTARWYGISTGCYVESVSSDEAAQAGLQRGDLIVAVDDVEVSSATTLETYIAGKKPGDAVSLSVIRYGRSGSQSITLTLTLSENTGKSE